jgi:hypothetical protein
VTGIATRLGQVSKQLAAKPAKQGTELLHPGGDGPGPSPAGGSGGRGRPGAAAAADAAERAAGTARGAAVQVVTDEKASAEQARKEEREARSAGLAGRGVHRRRGRRGLWAGPATGPRT